jgi:hypothetical protein
MQAWEDSPKFAPLGPCIEAARAVLRAWGTWREAGPGRLPVELSITIGENPAERALVDAATGETVMLLVSFLAEDVSRLMRARGLEEVRRWELPSAELRSAVSAVELTVRIVVLASHGGALCRYTWIGDYAPADRAPAGKQN